MDFIVMGVSGCGKSTVGKLLAETLGVDFLEGDAFHSKSNISRMEAGVPLTDGDRDPWLKQLSKTIHQYQQDEQGFVMTCSALKKSYRQQLSTHTDQLKFIYLKGARSVIYDRMANRENHFMEPSLIDSQFEALEEPGHDENSMMIPIGSSASQIVDTIIRMATEESHLE